MTYQDLSGHLQRLESAIRAELRGQSATAREVRIRLSRQGFSGISKSEVNSVLYTLLSKGLLACHTSGGAPVWSEPAPPKPLTDSRPTVFEPARFQVPEFDSEVPVVIQFAEHLSNNDPYISVDLLGTQVLVQINTEHPYFANALPAPTTRQIALFSACVDAYVLYRMIRQGQEPAAIAFLKIRDNALRLFNRAPTSP